ncbi:MAG: TIGR04283 family arsenosugar biosynthesis glycosyltransferase [Cyanobacteria bacterium MAG CAR4_bin_6]|nr:TIGR04283 family arsenosugar biosynthesis glycosyltransferase [Cyanobacteria bacterium MAG CAR4_bin_6]
MPPEAAPTLSWIVPARQEAGMLALLLADLQNGLVGEDELIVVDGESRDATGTVARLHGARVVSAPPSRGGQLRHGVSQARGQRLVFIHADSRLAGGAELSRRLRRLPSGQARCFRLKVDDPHPCFRVLERLVALRTTLLGLPYGDQGLVLDRRLYEACGGFRDLPLMEDVDLVLRLRQWGGVRQLPYSIRTSARRWRRHGLLRTSLRNMILMLRWLLGEKSETLKRDYYS